jgi:uncharacterized membrane protein YfcA
MELALWFIFAIVISAFICEYVDSTLGMGYGTTLTPVLLIGGFSPMQVVPAILLSELISGILAGYFHHFEGNVDFKPKTMNIFKIKDLIRSCGFFNGLRKTLSFHSKIVLLLASCSIIGTLMAVFIAVNIPKFYLKLYIGVLVFSMGLLILILNKKNFKFSKRKIFFLGFLASFNKGMSGGGYGPVVTSGQILSGIHSRSAVGITSLAEGLTCLVGVLAYALISTNSVDWSLAPYIVTGAVLSVPFSAKSVKYISNNQLKLAIAILTISLGILTIVKTIV